MSIEVHGSGRRWWGTAAIWMGCAVLFFSGCAGSGGDPEPGSPGGPCYPNGTCDMGLACTAGVCLCDGDDPCDGVDCGEHGDCAALRGSPVCVCDEGHHPEELICVADPGSVCEGQDCSGHGTCAVAGEQAVCVCDSGYYSQALSCLMEPQPPCESVACSDHGFCATDLDGAALCVCDSGYHAEALECVGDPPPACEGVDCSGHGLCVADLDGAAFCLCDEGFDDDGLSCVPVPDSPCEGIECSGHGFCVANMEGAAFCFCDEGYYDDGLTCVPVPESPCDGVDCSGHGFCAVDPADNPFCVCDVGFEEDGLECTLVDDCSIMLEDDFDDGMVAPWTVVDGDVSVVEGRLRVVRVPLKWGVARQDLPQVVDGFFEAEARMQLLTDQSLVSLCLEDTASDPWQRYCMTLNTKTENGSQRGAHLLVNTIHDNSANDPDKELIEDNFDPGTQTEHTLRMTRSPDGQLDLFVDGVSVGSAIDNRIQRFDRIGLYGMQDTNAGHGGFFDDVRLVTCAAPECDLIQVEQLDELPLNLWTVATEPREGFAYLVGGYEVNNGPNTQCLANIWRYELATDSITDLGPILPYARYAQGRNEMAWADNGKLYISPGLGPTVNNGWGSHRCIIEFDPTGPTATEKACFASNRWNLGVVNGHDGYMYFLGGWNGGSLNDVWRYDPDTDQLTHTGATTPMPGNSIGYAIATTASGLSYIFTNQYAGRRLYSFDPSDLSFADLAGVDFTSAAAWISNDGLVHTLTGADPDNHRQLVTYDPAAGQLDIEDLGQSVFGERRNPAQCPDTAAGHLYAFGGSVLDSSQPIAEVERTSCLP